VRPSRPGLGTTSTSRGPRGCPHVAQKSTASATDALSNAAGDSNYVRVQILTPVGVLDREKQLGVVKEMTDIVASAAGDPGLVERTWVVITESPQGGWGIDGHAYTGAELAEAAHKELSGG
jgi:phenylpyruvate tautomerase PptA (4-oxalocrotonate tautomerase family)